MHIARRKGQSIDRPGVRAWGAGVGSEKNPSVAVMHHIIARYALLIDISAEYSRHREAGQREKCNLGRNRSGLDCGITTTRKLVQLSQRKARQGQAGSCT